MTPSSSSGTNIWGYVVSLAASLASGLLLFAAFPPAGFSLLAWLAMVPLLLVAIRGGVLKSFLLFFVFGVVFYTGIFSWMFKLSGYSLLHHAVLGLYLCPLTGIVGASTSYVSSCRGPAAALAAAPFFWVTQEYIHSHLSFLSLPWALLAHSQYQDPVVLQVASLTGAYGISLVIVLVNSAMASLVLTAAEKFKSTAQAGVTYFISGGNGVLAGVTAATLGAVLLYGSIQTSRPVDGQNVRVALIQGNIEQSQKWDKKYAPLIMKIYADLTRKASRHKPALVIWPETATPGAINKDRRLYRQVKELAQSTGIPILLGSAQVQKFKVEGNRVKNLKYLNSAYLVSPRDANGPGQRYDKLRLLPFGEYLPYRDKVRWSYLRVPDVGHYLPGKQYTIFHINDRRFAVTICWENIFADTVRQFARAGAQFIVNITNEAWFGKSAAPYQFLSMSVLRSVESGIFVVRCANTGVSCIIDPCGRIAQRVQDKQGRDIFVRGMLIGSVVPMESHTLYSRYGDWFAGLCAVVSLATLFLAFIKKTPAGKYET